MSYNMKKDTIICLKDISKVYKLYSNKTDRFKEALSFRGKKFHKEFHALKNINLEIEKGEIIGIVGRNGSGKSTLLKIITNILTPTTGVVKTEGRIVPLLELGSGFHPEYTGLENIYFHNSFLGYSNSATDKKLDTILEFADIGDHIYQPLKTYSSGMKARLAFAVSVNVNPDILILDEILSVGDVSFKRKSYSVMEQFFNQGKTIIYVTHSLSSVNDLCTRAIMMHKGEVILDGPPKFVTMNFQKFMFAEPEKQIEILDIMRNFKKADIEKQYSEINNSEKHSDEPKKNKSSLLNEETSYYLPSLRSETSTQLNNFNLVLHYLTIYNKKNIKVNVLRSFNSYQIKISGTYPKLPGEVRYIVGITDEKGKSLSWASTPENNAYHNVKDINFNIDIEFKCLLHSGNYFLNFAIRTIDNRILYRETDMYLFKVQNENNGFKKDKGGVFDSSFCFKLK
ncbi:MAG: ATP-binding cassette domain-containing protein [Bacteroidia bacterium]|nr:ATP-binding cassette domain-containing protein [Bacteroidia bacterium]